MWLRVADVGSIGPGEMRQVETGGKTLTLGNHQGCLFALDDRCPHAGASLSGGSIEDGLLVCPWHGRAYDPATGQCDGYQGVRAYPVEVRSDGVFVAVEEPAKPLDVQTGTP